MSSEFVDISNDTDPAFALKERKATNTEKLVIWPVLKPEIFRFQIYSLLWLHRTHAIIFNFREL
jgi:hypothetical protein